VSQIKSVGQQITKFRGTLRFVTGASAGGVADGLAGHAVDVLLYVAYTVLYSNIGYILYSLRGHARFTVLRLIGKGEGKGPSIHLI